MSEINRDEHKILTEQAMRKIEIRERNRELWVKEQLENSNYLNKLNCMYKQRKSLEMLPGVKSKSISPQRELTSTLSMNDLDPSKGVNRVVLGDDEHQKKRKEDIKLNLKNNVMLN